MSTMKCMLTQLNSDYVGRGKPGILLYKRTFSFKKENAYKQN